MRKKKYFILVRNLAVSYSMKKRNLPRKLFMEAKLCEDSLFVKLLTPALEQQREHVNSNVTVMLKCKARRAGDCLRFWESFQT